MSGRILAPLSKTRALLSLTGPDVPTYLQGLTTNSIPALLSHPPNSSAHFSAFLNAQGRLLHDIFLYPTTHTSLDGETQPGIYVECDREQVDTVQKLLKRYKLRSKVQIRRVEDGELSVVAFWKKAGESGSDVGSEVLSGLPALTITDPRAPGLGFRGLWSEKDVKAASEAVELVGLDKDIGETAYRHRRYTWGIPEGGRELISGSALPLEANYDYMRGVDFKKGCYVGQELTIRTRHRGVVRKRILPIVLYEEGKEAPVEATSESDGSMEDLVAAEWGEVPSGTEIGRVGTSGRSAGKVLGSLGNIGLGLCRLEVMTGPEAGEFAVQWEGDGIPRRLRVEARVPWWHAERADK